jgi:hypothetical protein
LTEEPQIMRMEIAHDHVQDGPAGQGKQYRQLHHRETAARLLSSGLRVSFLMGWRVRQLGGGAINHFDWSALEVAAAASPLVGRPGGGGEGLGQTLRRQTLACLHVSRGAFVDQSAANQAGQRLDLANHFPTGRVGIEHLPDKALEGQAQGISALPAVGTLVLGGQHVVWDQLAQVLTELNEGGLAQTATGAATQGGQPGAKGGEE